MDEPAAQSVFEVEADVDWTWKDRYRSIYRTWVDEPGQVLLSDPRGVIGLGIVSLFILMGTVGVLLYPVPTPEGPTFVRPFTDLAHPLGTQNRGMDVLGMIIHSTPYMLKMILAGSIFATVMSVVVGVTAGYKGGRTDTILSVLADIALAIPGLPLVIVLSFAIQPTNPYLVGLILTINAWGGLARSIRSQVLTIRQESYIEKSRSLGLDDRTIIFRDITPPILPYVAVGFVNQARIVIFSSVGLYFLGILPFESLNWGVMINLAFEGGAHYQTSLLYWVLIPMITVILLSLGFMLLAQSLDHVFNPRARARQEGRTETTEAAVQEL